MDLPFAQKRWCGAAGVTNVTTAIGKDFLPGGALAARTPSGGVQLSHLGLAGILAGIDEGLEVNVLGLTFGVAVKRPALKLPIVGRVPG